MEKNMLENSIISSTGSKNYNVPPEPEAPRSCQMQAKPANTDWNLYKELHELAELDRAFKESGAKVDRSFEELMKVVKMCLAKMTQILESMREGRKEREAIWRSLGKFYPDLVPETFKKNAAPRSDARDKQGDRQ
jgi:hypothetical protein